MMQWLSKQINPESDLPITSIPDLETRLAELAQVLGRLNALEARRLQRINEINALYTQRTVGLKEQAETLTATIKDWCEQNKATLLGTTKNRSLTFPTATLGWRKGKSQLVVEDEPTVIAALEAAGLSRYVKTAKSLKKSVLSTEWGSLPTIEGLTYSPGEDQFFIEPQKNLPNDV